MSEESDHGATTIRASKGGGAGKWLVGGAAAVVLLGGGYLAWKNFAPGQDGAQPPQAETQTAYNDTASMPQAGPVQQDAGAAADAATAGEAAPSSPVAASPRTSSSGASPSRAASPAPAAPETTIGITPVSATTTYEDEGVVVTAPRPVWTRMPDRHWLSATYPASALEQHREGEARLHCTVQAGGALDCVRVEDTPGGFGAAAMRVARSLRHAPQLADGSDAVGSDLYLHVVFRLPEQRRG
jgi:TonB family protein